MRLQKYLAMCGIASRRKSEEIIQEGRVKVNNLIIKEKGYKINPGDIVLFDDKKIKLSEKIYIVLNKPRDYICSHKDKSGRKTIYDLVKIEKARLFSVGRLDRDSSGLLILTNDGDFANNIIHPSNNIIKEYYLESYNKIPEELLNDFKNGILIENIMYRAEDIVYKNNKNSCSIFLKEGKKREIRVVFKKYFVNIKILKRMAIGKLRLDLLNLKEGKYKIFSLDELNRLINGNK